MKSGNFKRGWRKTINTNKKKRAEARKYYLKHREFYRLKYLKNRTAILKRNKTYYLKNKDKVKAQRRSYYLKNKKRILKQMQKNRLKNFQQRKVYLHKYYMRHKK